MHLVTEESLTRRERSCNCDKGVKVERVTCGYKKAREGGALSDATTIEDFDSEDNTSLKEAVSNYEAVSTPNNMSARTGA